MEKDISRIAVERAIETVVRVKAEFKKRIPYGPSMAKMSKAEARKMHEKMSPDERVRMADSMGRDKYLAMLEKLYG